MAGFVLANLLIVGLIYLLVVGPALLSPFPPVATEPLFASLSPRQSVFAVSIWLGTLVTVVLSAVGVVRW